MRIQSKPRIRQKNFVHVFTVQWLQFVAVACVFAALYRTKGQIQESIALHNEMSAFRTDSKISDSAITDESRYVRKPAEEASISQQPEMTFLFPVETETLVDDKDMDDNIVIDIGLQDKHDQGIKIPDPTFPAESENIERAIAVISMGSKAAKTQIVERFVWSLRNTGNFTGWVVLLTDAPPGRYASISNWTDNFVSVKPIEEDFSKGHHHIEMARKRFKTYVIDYMNLDRRLDSVRLIYYLDVDIVFGSPVAPLFEGLEAKYKIGKSNPDDAAKMWMFKGTSRRWSIQGGQMILDRKSSKPCLERWRWHMDRNLTVKKDQVFLNDMVAEQRKGKKGIKCKIVAMEQKPYIEFPEKWDMVDVAQKVKSSVNRTSGRTYSPLVHIRNTANLKMTSKWNYRLYIEDVLGVDKSNWKDPLNITNKIVFG